MKILDQIDMFLNEEKKELPPHLKKLIKQIKEKEKELKKYGFTVTDKTPKGYGPGEQ